MKIGLLYLCVVDMCVRGGRASKACGGASRISHSKQSAPAPNSFGGASGHRDCVRADLLQGKLHSNTRARRL